MVVPESTTTASKETKMIYSVSQDNTQVVIILEGQFKDLPISTVLYSLAEQIYKQEQSNVANQSRGEEERSREDSDGSDTYCGAV